jgi:hypothetical protein
MRDSSLILGGTFSFCDIRRNAHFRRMQMTLEARGMPANAMRPVLDYPSVMVLEVTEEGGLVQAFVKEGRVQYVLPT